MANGFHDVNKIVALPVLYKFRKKQQKQYYSTTYIVHHFDFAYTKTKNQSRVVYDNPLISSHLPHLPIHDFGQI